MKLLTVIILYTDESKKFIPDIKEMILKKLFSPNEINFVEEYVGEESLKIKNIEQLNKFDSKYLYIVNAEDEVVFLELVLDVLRERDADIVYNDFIILHEDSEKPEISSSDMLLKTYYNKIIKIEYLKKLVIYDGIYFDEILYEISLEKDIKIFKYPLLSYIVKHKIHIIQSFEDFEINELDDSLNYTIDGIEYNANIQLRSIIPLAKEYLSNRELYDLNYSSSVIIPIIMDILKKYKSGVLYKVFLGVYDISEIINGLIIYQGVEDIGNLSPYTKFLYTLEKTPKFNGLNIIISPNQSNTLNEYLQKNITIPHKVYYLPKDLNDLEFIDKLIYKYTWIVGDKVEKICLLDLSVQTNDCEFILFNQEKDKIRTVSEVENLSTENMWVKTDILKKQKTLDFKLENDIDNIMFNIRKLYK